MVRLNACNAHTARVRYLGRDVHGKWMYPLRVDAKHVHDEVRGALRAVDRAALPVGGEVCVMV